MLYKSRTSLQIKFTQTDRYHSYLIYSGVQNVCVSSTNDLPSSRRKYRAPHNPLPSNSSLVPRYSRSGTPVFRIGTIRMVEDRRLGGSHFLVRVDESPITATSHIPPGSPVLVFPPRRGIFARFPPVDGRRRGSGSVCSQGKGRRHVDDPKTTFLHRKGLTLLSLKIIWHS